MLIESFVPMLGLMLIFVSASRMRVSQQLPMRQKTHFLFGGVVFLTLIAVLLRTPGRIWIFSLVVSGIILAFSAWERVFRGDFRLEEAIQCLDQVVLSMKSGRSLRASLRELSLETGDFARATRLQSLLLELESGKQPDPHKKISATMLKEIRGIEKRGMKAIEGVESLRSDFKLRENFRRRSGQLTLQARVQAMIAALLYLPVLIFQISSGHGLQMRTGISVVLFASSQIWIHWMFRRFKWTI